MNKSYPFCYFNGVLQKFTNPVDLNNLIASFSPQTIFETILIDQAKPILLSEHLARFREAIRSVYQGEDQLTSPKPSPKLEEGLLKEQINDLIKKNQADLARLNIYYEKLTADKVQLLICLRVLTKDYMETPVTLKLQKSNQRTSWHQFKLLGHQNQPQLPVNQDFLYFNEQNEILETTRANVFFIKNNTLITPPTNNIIPGVIRGWLVANHTKLGFGLEERIIRLEEISEFEEVFLTNSLRGIIRVKALLK